jgi:hypothetical protein
MFCAYGAPPGKIKGRLQAMQDLRTKWRLWLKKAFSSRTHYFWSAIFKFSW